MTGVLRFLVMLSCFLHGGAALAELRAGPLVSVEWLKSNLSQNELVILDIRSPRPNRNFYNEGHIPGSVSVPYNEGWRVTRDGVVGMLPEPEELQELWRSAGLNTDDRVVIVPFGNSSTDFGAATRAYWTLKAMGHDSVSILDGGYRAWLLARGPLSKDKVSIEPGDFVAKPRPEMIATESEVQASLRGDTLRLDARPQPQFQGRAKSPVVEKAGTIPGSLNTPQSRFYDRGSARFIDAAGLSEFVDTGGEEPIIAFCNTGHWASLAWFAVSEIAGRSSVKLYDGSMAEWTRNDGNPVQAKE